MSTPFHASTVLYAKNLDLVQAFYRRVLNLNVEHAESGFNIIGPPSVHTAACQIFVAPSVNCNEAIVGAEFTLT
jgi:hypothetical protein